VPAKANNVVKLPRKLPKRLRPLFWDTPFYRLNGAAHGDFVAYRILEAGDWESLKWLCRTVGDEPLRQLVAKRHGCGLSREQLRFWQAMWRLPKRTVDAWLNAEGRDIWDRRAS
jgi:hypothetical protein